MLKGEENVVGDALLWLDMEEEAEPDWNAKECQTYDNAIFPS